MHVFRSATLLEWLCTSVSLHKCHCIPRPHHGAGHVLHVGDVGEGRRHLEEHVRSQPRPRHRHHPLNVSMLWGDKETVQSRLVSVLISRRLLQMFLIQLIHSRRVTFNSVKVCHCFSPQTQHPRHCLQEQNIFQTTWNYFLILTPQQCGTHLVCLINHVIDPFLKVCQDFQRKISSLLTSVFVWWWKHLTHWHWR